MNEAVLTGTDALPDFSDASMMHTVEVMRRVLSKRFGLDGQGLSLDQDLAALGLDSLAFIEYAFELEGELHVSLPDVPRDLVKVRDFAKFVHAEVVRSTPAAAE